MRLNLERNWIGNNRWYINIQDAKILLNIEYDHAVDLDYLRHCTVPLSVHVNGCLCSLGFTMMGGYPVWYVSPFFGQTLPLK